MELNGFMIGPEIKKLFKIKVGTLTVRHPVEECNFFTSFSQNLGFVDMPIPVSMYVQIDPMNSTLANGPYIGFL